MNGLTRQCTRSARKVVQAGDFELERLLFGNLVVGFGYLAVVAASAPVKILAPPTWLCLIISGERHFLLVLTEHHQA